MSLDFPSLETCIREIGENAHGHSKLTDLKTLLKKAKVQEILSFWKTHGIKEPITWHQTYIYLLKPLFFLEALNDLLCLL